MALFSKKLSILQKTKFNNNGQQIPSFARAALLAALYKFLKNERIFIKFDISSDKTCLKTNILIFIGNGMVAG